MMMMMMMTTFANTTRKLGGAAAAIRALASLRLLKVYKLYNENVNKVILFDTQNENRNCIIMKANLDKWHAL